MPAPVCPTCKTVARLTVGAEVYTRKPHLAEKVVWKCDVCPDTFVGCHDGTTVALGTPADRAAREARHSLHRWKLDPLWEEAVACPAYRRAPRNKGAQAGIKRVARQRVYAYLADRMGLTVAETHTGLFTSDQCRIASAILSTVTYAEIRRWAHAQRDAADRAARLADAPSPL